VDLIKPDTLKIILEKISKSNVNTNLNKVCTGRVFGIIISGLFYNFEISSEFVTVYNPHRLTLNTGYGHKCWPREGCGAKEPETGRGSSEVAFALPGS
jgi:hypothetical protein